jgi:hypothetical protein
LNDIHHMMHRKICNRSDGLNIMKVGGLAQAGDRSTSTNVNIRENDPANTTFRDYVPGEPVIGRRFAPTRWQT